MRLLVAAYEGVRIFLDRPYGYKRYHVLWSDGTEEMFSGLWYSEKKVKAIVEKKVHG